MNIPGTRSKDLRRMDHLIGDSETNFTTPKEVFSKIHPNLVSLTSKNMYEFSLLNSLA